MAGEETTSVNLDTGHPDGDAPDTAQNRYDQEQTDPSVGTEQNSPSQSSDSESSGENESQEQQEQQDSNESSQSESDSQNERDSSQDSEEQSNEEDTETQEEEQQSDFQQYFDEYRTNGELSEESLQKLENEHGVSRETVQDYIASRTNLAAAIETAVLKEVGGQEQFNAIAEYARNNLSESEIQTFNREVNSGDVNRALEAARNVQSKFNDAHGSEGADVTGGESRNTSGVTPYTSQEEMQADMRSDRYHNDPAFREQVRSRIAASNI